jgi:hypothetical protein
VGSAFLPRRVKATGFNKKGGGEGEEPSIPSPTLAVSYIQAASTIIMAYPNPTTSAGITGWFVSGR